MNKNKLKHFLLAAFSVLLVAAFAFSSFAAANTLSEMLGDVDNDGKITSRDARIILRVAARLETLSNPGDEQPAFDIETVIAAVDSDEEIGGSFIGGESKATFRITANEDVGGIVTLYIFDQYNKTVFSTELAKSMQKKQTATAAWDGIDKDGDYVSTGDYTVFVEAKNANDRLQEDLHFITKAEKPFPAGGNGSEQNPFLVSSVADLEKISRYPRNYFKQTQDIDYDLSVARSLTSVDEPFSGVYDGNNRKIKNATVYNSLFKEIGADGVVKNLTFTGVTVNAKDITDGDKKASCVGGLVETNNGKLENITVENSAFTTCGGLVFTNTETGMIRNCKISADLTVSDPVTNEVNIGLVAAKNCGAIDRCDASGTVSCNNSKNGTSIRIGGIVGSNEGRVLTCKFVSDQAGGKPCMIRLSRCVSYSSIYTKYVGGIAGYNNNTLDGCECSASFDLDEPSKENVTIGGIVGYSESDLQNCTWSGSEDIGKVGNR